jgi:general stress protein YciG
MNKAMSVSEAGRKGGKARAAKLTKARRIEIARQGYHASPLSVKRAKVEPNDKITENKLEDISCA